MAGYGKKGKNIWFKKAEALTLSLPEYNNIIQSEVSQAEDLEDISLDVLGVSKSQEEVTKATKKSRRFVKW